MVPATAHALCATPPVLVLNEGVAAPADGGVLVANLRDEASGDTLAPGLFVYKLPLLLQGDAPSPLDAPKLRWAKRAERRGDHRHETLVAVRLDGRVPADVVAVVAVDVQSNARSFNLATEGESGTKLVYYAGKCAANPRDTVETKVGERIAIRWVDKYGRLSPPSKPVIVARGKWFD